MRQRQEAETTTMAGIFTKLSKVEALYNNIGLGYLQEFTNIRAIHIIAHLMHNCNTACQTYTLILSWIFQYLLIATLLSATFLD